MFLRMADYRIILLSVMLGLVWGSATQWVLTNWRGIPIVTDNGWETALLWLLGLLTLLRLLAPCPAPLVLGFIGAAFWVSAVIGYYAYYVSMLTLGLSAQGATLDLSQPDSYRGLWYLFKSSILQWLVLALVGGFGISWAWSLALRRRPRK